MFKRISMVLSAAVLLTVVPASASIVRTYGENYDLGGDTKWKSDADLGGSGALVTDTGFAGAYKVRIDTTSGPYQQAFCLDLFLGIDATNSNPGYTENLVLPTSTTLADYTRVSRAAWIFSDVFPNISALATQNSTNVQTIAVALQFALWEVMIDNPTSSANGWGLESGYFQKNSSGVTGSGIDYAKATSLASSFISAHQGTVDTAAANRSVVLVDVGWTSSYGPQRLITYPGNQVPEPATMALFGSALTVLGLMARRRKV